MQRLFNFRDEYDSISFIIHLQNTTVLRMKRFRHFSDKNTFMLLNSMLYFLLLINLPFLQQTDSTKFTTAALRYTSNDYIDVSCDKTFSASKSLSWIAGYIVFMFCQDFYHLGPDVCNTMKCTLSCIHFKAEVKVSRSFLTRSYLINSFINVVNWW